ncbi:unnamed protein product [Hyaloperonospora brassicae]|uniref:Cell 12A endoglucanase n=1 Tax=Hyaloperonospora brassicae TaxID=162125 RepID=A0AAV0TP93_HYABA|nr:unnamed protein product [Hyaloperonospora brassicae]
MKVLLSVAVIAATLSAASAAKTCDQWGQTKSGDYIIYNNLWGSSAATEGGKQCTGLDSASGDTVAWQTTWTWNGGNTSVKSYANAALTFDAVPLTEVTSVPSLIEFEVKYSGTVVANVAYDLFTSSKPDGEKEFEIMIWLAAIGGAGPISSTGKPIDEGVAIEGTDWNVFSGPNGEMMVYSFVASTPGKGFDGDLLAFFTYLEKSQKFDMSQYLIKVECGTEPFVGTDVTLKVSKYSAAVETGKGGSSAPAAAGSSLGDSPVSQEEETGASSEKEVEEGTPVPDDNATKGSPEEEVTGPGPEEEEETPDLGGGSTTGEEEPAETPDPALSPAVETPPASSEDPSLPDTPILKTKCIVRRD